MKKLPLLLSIGLYSFVSANSLPAQTPTPSPTLAPLADPAATPPADREGHHGGMFKNLSPQERQELRKAHAEAKADPAVQAAEASGDKRAAHQAIRQAMLKDDPSVAPVLDKLRAEGRKGAAGAPAAGTAPRGEQMEKRLAFLPEDERTKLTTAARSAQSDPQVTALRQQWTAATTPDAKAEAGKAYRLAMRNAMLRNDPSLAPIMQKVQEHREAQLDEGSF